MSRLSFNTLKCVYEEEEEENEDKDEE